MFKGLRARLDWPSPATVIALIALVVATGGVTYAAIPHSKTDEIAACYDKSTGDLRVIDAQAGRKCRSGELALAWNVEGQKGKTGAQGPKGDKGPKGDPGTNGTNGTNGAACLPSNPACVGPQGPPGTNGTNGTDGAACLPSNPACVGPKGDKGDPGSAASVTTYSRFGTGSTEASFDRVFCDAVGDKAVGGGGTVAFAASTALTGSQQILDPGTGLEGWGARSSVGPSGGGAFAMVVCLRTS